MANITNSLTFSPTKLHTTPLSAIALDRIEPPDNPVRLSPKETNIDELAESIKEIGLLQPILVKKDGDKDKVIAGHRRYLAGKKLGYTPVPALISESNGSSTIKQMLAENISREDMSPIEEAAAIKDAIDTTDHTRASIAKALGKSLMYVRKRLELLDMAPKLQKAVHEGKLAIATALILDEITDQETQDRYLTDTIQKQYSSQTVRNWVDVWKTHQHYKEIEGENEHFDDPDAPPMELSFPCEICGKQKTQPHLRSIIICNECLPLAREFLRQYAEVSRKKQ